MDDYYLISKNKNARKSMCKDCDKKKNKEYYLKNKEELYAKKIEWRKDNPGKQKSYSDRYRKKNADKVRSKIRFLSAERVRTLSDVYIMQLLCKKKGIDKSLVTPGVIELKRQELILKRTIKEKLNQ